MTYSRIEMIELLKKACRKYKAGITFLLSDIDDDGTCSDSVVARYKEPRGGLAHIIITFKYEGNSFEIFGQCDEGDAFISFDGRIHGVYGWELSGGYNSNHSTLSGKVGGILLDGESLYSNDFNHNHKQKFMDIVSNLSKLVTCCKFIDEYKEPLEKEISVEDM